MVNEKSTFLVGGSSSSVTKLNLDNPNDQGTIYIQNQKNPKTMTKKGIHFAKAVKLR